MQINQIIMAKKKRTVKSLILERKREAMKEAGAYDGRFMPKTFKDKTKYNRKKSKNDNE